MIFILLILSGIYSGQAQIIVWQKFPERKIVVRVNGSITPSVIRERIGEPAKYWEQFDDECYGGMYRIFEYEGLNFSTVDHVVHDIGITSDKYEIVLYDKYRVSVGDGVSMFKETLSASDVRIDEGDGNMEIHFKVPKANVFSDEYLTVGYDSHGIIQELSWSIPI